MRKAALVTGGARGIGLGICRCLAAEGFDLAIADIQDENAVTKPLTELRSLGAQVHYVRADIGVSEERRVIVPRVRERLGRLHLLVNNAGVAPRERKDLLEATEESFEWVMRINLQGPYFLTQDVSRWMIAQKKETASYTACIVNITSISAAVASVNRGEYCISKSGLSMATRLWAVRLAEFGIPVYEIRPGIIRTEMTAGVQAKYDALISEGLLLQPRWGEPGDVGKAVAVLARGDLGYSTGQVLYLDGGLMVRRL
jgi:3-oxoacyl-[acyl-carrier protein] reductase